MNIPTEKMLEKVWAAGGKWEADESKLEKIKLKTIPSEKVKPPTLSECAASIECYEEDSRKVGDHVLILGRVVAIHANTKYVDEDGQLKVDVVRPPLHISSNLFAFPYVTKAVKG